MTRRKDGDENEDVNVVTNYDDLLDEMFTERSDTSEKDHGLTISIDWSENTIETRRSEADLTSTRSNDESTESMDSDNPSTTSCAVEKFPKVDVPEAVLFDSHSRFYLKGGRAQLQHNALLPGDQVYTFWMEENTNGASVQASTPPALDIDFKLIFKFDPDDRISHSMEAELARAASDGNDAIRTLTPEGISQLNGRTNSYSPCLFMPPKRDTEVTVHSDDTTKPTEKLSTLSKKNGVKRGNQKQDVKASPIRHAGASIVRGPLPHPQDKVTVYRPDKLDLDPATESPTLHHSDASDRRIINQMESAYHEMQPRLFR
ncbi:hypothetical protein AM588_10003909 [Phytophthora nicotianae]|uniref:Uncharacterized protein n=1 Tax=Phytophthora nicotianae TaxID=4792 RepID=A0A0W8CX98_PHYNI|nr:hypothetical protein AM588_10003909 [Phytophthora nicotianae]